jgi:ankyrin repeat protein
VKVTTLSLTLALFACDLLATARAASFDCSKATTSVEKSICAEPELSELDEQLNFLYQMLLSNASFAPTARLAQRNWLMSRNRCKDTVCIRKAYIDQKQFVNANFLPEDRNRSLHSMVARGDLKAVKLLISIGADVNATGFEKGSYEATSLHYAAVLEAKHMSELLIDNGAKLDVVSEFGSPLYIASYYGRNEIVALLVDRGCDTKLRAPLGNLPLHAAAQTGKKETIQLLLSRGADVNSKGYLGRTALHIAASESHLEIVELLLEKGADVNARNENEGTPLHEVAARGVGAAVERLVKRGAAIDAKDNKGRTPLFLARELKQVGAANVLLTLGAKE